MDIINCYNCNINNEFKNFKIDEKNNKFICKNCNTELSEINIFKELSYNNIVKLNSILNFNNLIIDEKFLELIETPNLYASNQKKYFLYLIFNIISIDNYSDNTINLKMFENEINNINKNVKIIKNLLIKKEKLKFYDYLDKDIRDLNNNLLVLEIKKPDELEQISNTKNKLKELIVERNEYRSHRSQIFINIEKYKKVKDNFIYELRKKIVEHISNNLSKDNNFDLFKNTENYNKFYYNLIRNYNLNLICEKYNYYNENYKCNVLKYMMDNLSDMKKIDFSVIFTNKDYTEEDVKIFISELLNVLFIDYKKFIDNIVYNLKMIYERLENFYKRHILYSNNILEYDINSDSHKSDKSLDESSDESEYNSNIKINTNNLFVFFNNKNILYSKDISIFKELLLISLIKVFKNNKKYNQEFLNNPIFKNKYSLYKKNIEHTFKERSNLKSINFYNKIYNYTSDKYNSSCFINLF